MRIKYKKQILVTLVLSVALLLSLSIFVPRSATVYAGDTSNQACSQSGTKGLDGTPINSSSCHFSSAGTQCSSSACNIIQKYVDGGINLFSILVGVVAVASIIMGGISYSTSGGDPQKAAKAKARITNTILALIIYGFLFGFLQFIIPGGLFHQ